MVRQTGKKLGEQLGSTCSNKSEQWSSLEKSDNGGEKMVKKYWKSVYFIKVKPIVIDERMIVK